QGKKLLQKRLTARGLTMTGLMLSLMLSPGSEVVAVSSGLAANTLRAVLLFASGQQAVAASPEAVHPAGQALKQLIIAHVRQRATSFALALALAVGGLGAWQVFGHRAARANSVVTSPSANEAPATRDAATVAREKATDPEAASKIAGPVALVRGKVLDAAGHV